MLKRIKKCKRCGLPEGTRGMIEDGLFISEVAYLMGRGSLEAKNIKIQLDENSICNVCVNSN